MSTAPLFEPIGIGPLSLSHRVVMAPLTRMRATIPGEAPNALNAEYYAQRATPGGLIIAEASQVVPGGKMINSTPGIHTDEQIAGWKPVVDAVHAKGGFIYLQLWHVGRLSHSSYQPDGGAPMAPSPVAATGKVKTADGETVDKQVPREMSLQEIADLIQAYAQAAKNAKAAGFDGVEVHSANGYLLEQFMQTRSNQRTDQYGGSVENRCRLSIEVTAAVAEVFGPERVGIRLTPFGVANDSGEDDPEPLYRYIIQQLDKMGLAYLHLIEPRASGAGQGEVDHQDVPSAAELYRKDWHGVLMTAGNFRGDSAADFVRRGVADAIAFGRFFISNPDLPERIRNGQELTPYDRSTFYTRGEAGYTDYQPMNPNG